MKHISICIIRREWDLHLPKYHDNTNLVPIPKELHDQLEHVCAVTQVRDITRDTGDGMMEGE